MNWKANLKKSKSHYDDQVIYNCIKKSISDLQTDKEYYNKCSYLEDEKTHKGAVAAVIREGI